MYHLSSWLKCKTRWAWKNSAKHGQAVLTRPTQQRTYAPFPRHKFLKMSKGLWANWTKGLGYDVQRTTWSVQVNTGMHNGWVVWRNPIHAQFLFLLPKPNGSIIQKSGWPFPWSGGTQQTGTLSVIVWDMHGLTYNITESAGSSLWETFWTF